MATHWKKLTNPLYLGAYSIENGQDVIMTISKVQVERVVGADGKKEECTVAHFTDSPEGKPMILNTTNCKTIAKLLGTPYIENWAGHKIQVGVEKVKAFGDVVEALRVRTFLPKIMAIECEKCGKTIMAANGMSPDQLAAYTAKKYGAKLCAKCATEAAKMNSQNEAVKSDAVSTDTE